MAEERTWRDCILRTIIPLRINASHPDADAFDYIVDWDDGNVERFEDKSGTMDVYHEYTTGGVFTPTLKATTHRFGCKTLTDEIELDDSPIYILGADLEINSLSSTVVHANIGDAITFRATPIGCRTGYCHVIFIWGDGTANTIRYDVEMGKTVEATHQYKSAYTFNFQLTLMGAGFAYNNFPTSNLPIRFIEVS